MPTFRYTAKKNPTETVEGVIEADNRSGVLAYLSQLGYTPVRINEQVDGQPVAVAQPRKAPARAGRVPSRQMTLFTRQFASLARSQVPLLRTLQILEEQARHAHLRDVLHALAEEVRQGQPLSSGLKKYPGAFSPLYVNLVTSGEISGALDEVLERLADQGEREDELRAKVRAAFTYPVFVAVVGLLTVIFLMTFVMPKLSSLLKGFGDNLPLATRWLLAIAAWMTTKTFWIGLVSIIGVCLLVWKLSGEKGRLVRDRLLLKLPLVGQLVHELELSCFARSFGLLISHGISVLKAMEVAAPAVSHRVIRAQLDRIPEGLRQGKSLSSCLKELSLSTPFLVNTVAVGEETGRIGDALNEVAGYYERDAHRLLQLMASLLEPMLIVTVGLIVGFIVMAVLLPIFEMSSLR